MFVAHPAKAPTRKMVVYKRPDDPVNSSQTFRDIIEENNRDLTDNPSTLLPAWQLYSNPVYEQLVHRYGVRNVYILSAGWGLIAADFHIPDYDITFSNSADKFKRRRPRDQYRDFSMLPKNTSSRIIFLGGKDYVSLFCKLTGDVKGERVVFYNSRIPPSAPGCRLVRFPTSTRTNWHYECAKKLIQEAISV